MYAKGKKETLIWSPLDGRMYKYGPRSIDQTSPMLRNIFRTSKWAAPSKTSSILPASRITIYHNPSCNQAAQLLQKLNNYAALPCTANKYSGNTIGALLLSKFNIDVKSSQHLSFEDYQFIVDECLDIHPDNKIIASKLFKEGQVDKYLHLSAQDFVKLCKDAMSKSTVIIDYSNRLIANDEATFDRIMANYLSCGIQHSSNGNIRNISHTHHIVAPKTEQPLQHASAAAAAAAATASEFYKYTNMVHPNVAEFADLF